MTVLCLLAVVLTLLPAVNTFYNLSRLRMPPLPTVVPSVAILIPARNEAASIGACLDAALASEGVDFEVVVVDDESTDATWQVLEDRAAVDARLRYFKSRKLPQGLKGKPCACQLLSELTDRPYLLFIDADVRLAPMAAARLAGAGARDLISGVPRQLTRGIVETAVIPMINSLILGYLPVGLMRSRPLESLAVACGQLIMVRKSAYRQCGGHEAIARHMHDGMHLARLFRRLGYSTDLVDATKLAACRMYDSPGAVMQGFAKNATEGMARPLALPIWTLLLIGGHLLPLTLTGIILYGGLWTPLKGIVVACNLLLLLARSAQAIRCRESWLAVILHPCGVLLTLVIQWRALFDSLRGRQVTWRGRAYAPDG